MTILLLGRLLRAALASHAAEATALRQSACLIRSVRIFNGRSEAVQTDEVRVVGNRVEAISPQPIVPPAGIQTTIIDGGGRPLTPGSVGTHVHMSRVLTTAELQDTDPTYVAALELKGAEQALLRGFTTQRDMAGVVSGLKRAIDEDLVPGPRIYPSEAAPFQTSGHGDDRLRHRSHQRTGGAGAAEPGVHAPRTLVHAARDT